MANTSINNLKIRSASITNVVKEGRYNTEDVSKAERDYILKHTPKPRTQRTDLSAGNLVVVLEGAYTGKRVVFLQQLANNLALVSGISSLNGASVFKIDEMYLLKLSTSVELPTKININADNVVESKIGESSRMETEPTGAEKEIEQILLSAVTKTKFMKAYLAEPFKVDTSIEFYSQEY